VTGSVLVTGASGFIGRAVLPRLVDDGYVVHAVHRAPSFPAVPGVRSHRADLFDQSATESLVRAVQPSHLLHLAWYTTPQRFWASDQNLAWVEASLRLLRAFGAAGGARAVLAGTCAEYELRGRCSEADTPLRPASLYGVCKNALHGMATAHARDAGYSLSWARIFYLYGPREAGERLVPSVVRGLLAGRPVDVTDGRQRRDFLFVDDVASALVGLLGSSLAGPVNVGSGEAISVRRLVSAIGDNVARPELLRFGARASAGDEPPLVVADTTRLREGLGWRPTVRLEEGIDRTVSWWRDQLAYGS
jgi:nucleoside-diphosphate-sugar epimerase